jgi:glycosyltransferase involved in cell wall biosynthesis
MLIQRERKLALETDRIVAVSHATADDLVRLGVVEEERLVVVPPGVELDRLLALERPRPSGVGELRRLVGAGEDAVLLGFVARLAEVKRPGVAVDVFQAIAARHPELHLVFVGDGTERRALERRIGELGDDLSDRVHMIGAVLDTAPIFAELDAVLLTSRSEGLPVALVEAGAAGLPALATNVGGVSEVVAHERTGYMAETPDELAFALDQLLANPAERLAMGQRARLRVAERHSGAALADRLEALYTAVHGEAACAS